MSVVAILPTEQAVDAAWRRYQALAAEANANRRLWEDRAHVEAVIRAHKEFQDAFLAMDARK